MKFTDLIKKYENTRGIDHLNEATFNERNLEKVVKLYSKIMGITSKNLYWD